MLLSSIHYHAGVIWNHSAPGPCDYSHACFFQDSAVTMRVTEGMPISQWVYSVIGSHTKTLIRDVADAWLSSRL
jgi:hypothetical protein